MAILAVKVLIGLDFDTGRVGKGWWQVFLVLVGLAAVLGSVAVFF